jgi:hypothetical protein
MWFGISTQWNIIYCWKQNDQPMKRHEEAEMHTTKKRKPTGKGTH